MTQDIRRAVARGVSIGLLVLLGACATTTLAGRAHMTRVYLHVSDYDIDHVSIYCNGWKIQEFRGPPSLDGQAFWVRLGQCEAFTASARGVASEPIWAMSPISLPPGMPACVRIDANQVHLAAGPVCVR